MSGFQHIPEFLLLSAVILLQLKQVRLLLFGGGGEEFFLHLLGARKQRLLLPGVGRQLLLQEGVQP